MSPDLAKAVDQFLAGAVHSRASERTKESYRPSLLRFFEAAGVTGLADVRELDERGVLRAVKKLERDYKPSSVRQSVVVTRQFYKARRLEEPELQNPLVDISVSVPDNTPEWNVLHEGQTKELLAGIESPTDRAVVLALVLQGWRVSELCAMTWKNVRHQGDAYVIEWRAKRKKLRTQRLQPAVLEALGALDEESEPPIGSTRPLLRQADGRPYTRHDVYNLLRRACKRTGLRVTPHGLRATYLSSVIARKGIEAARQLGGHDSIATTQKYSRWKVDADDDLTVEDL